MAASFGDPAKAAALLSLPERTILNAIDQDPKLKKAWGGIPPTDLPNEAESFAGGNREMLLQVALRMEIEDSVLKRGVIGIGLSEGEAETAVALSRLSRDGFKPSLQVVNGSVTGACVKLWNELQSVIARLGDVRKQMGSVAKTDESYLVLMEEEDALQNHLTSTVDCLSQIQKNAVQSAAILAQVEATSTPTKSAKKGFSAAPIDIK